MNTPTQITQADTAQLSYSQTIYIKAWFKTMDSDGDVIYETQNAQREDGHFTLAKNVFIVAPEAQSVPADENTQETDNPFRKYMSGDIVGVRRNNGRLCSPALVALIGKKLTVVEDESEKSSSVMIMDDAGNVYTVDQAYLTLHATADEVNPFRTHHNKESKTCEVRRKCNSKVVASFCYGGDLPAYRQGAAWQAASDEERRLNLKYGKKLS